MEQGNRGQSRLEKSDDKGFVDVTSFDPKDGNPFFHLLDSRPAGKEVGLDPELSDGFLEGHAISAPSGREVSNEVGHVEARNAGGSDSLTKRAKG